MISDFEKEKVFWTRKMNLNLVKFMESKPNIWNPKHPKYTSVEKRDRTYAEFASKYGNEFTGQAVKDRWTNIRSTFTYYLRKVNSSRAKGDGEEYQVSWHLWNACHFLLKVSKKINKKTSEPLDSIKEEAKDEITSKEMNSDEECYDKPITDMDVTCENLANNIANVFRGMQNDVFGTDDTKYGHVGRTVAKRLTQMNSYDAAIISAKIMKILLLYDENNPENPNKSCLKSESQYLVLLF